jgi:hypothetical protein
VSRSDLSAEPAHARLKHSFNILKGIFWISSYTLRMFKLLEPSPEGESPGSYSSTPGRTRTRLHILAAFRLFTCQRAQTIQIRQLFAGRLAFRPATFSASGIVYYRDSRLCQPPRFVFLSFEFLANSRETKHGFYSRQIARYRPRPAAPGGLRRSPNDQRGEEYRASERSVKAFYVCRVRPVGAGV